MLDPIVFEHLLSLNRSVASALDVLKKLAEFQEFWTDDFQATSSYFREHLSNVNVSILEALHESEENAAGEAYQERRAYENQVRDPDDCYVEVIRREQERQQQGLPSLIGIQFEMRGAQMDMPIPSVNLDDDPESEEEPDESRDEIRRQRVIARVEALRAKQRMTKQEFHARIGASEARSWRSFVGADASEAWKRATPQMFEKIARLFSLDSAELLQ